MDLTSEVVSCSDKSVSSGGLYPPWVSITALASLEAARPTLGGSRPPLETLLPEEKKTSSVKSVSHVGKSHFSTVKVFPEWNHFSEPWNVFFWVSHLHLKWTFVARACEGHPRSTSGANGSRMGKHFTTRGTDFTKETFYKLRMGLCSILTWITKFLSVFNIVTVHFR